MDLSTMRTWCALAPIEGIELKDIVVVHDLNPRTVLQAVITSMKASK